MELIIPIWTFLEHSCDSKVPSQSANYHEYIINKLQSRHSLPFLYFYVSCFISQTWICVCKHDLILFQVNCQQSRVLTVLRPHTLRSVPLLQMVRLRSGAPCFLPAEGGRTGASVSQSATPGRKGCVISHLGWLNYFDSTIPG